MIPGSPSFGSVRTGHSGVETTTFENDRSAVEAAARVRAHLEPLLSAPAPETLARGAEIAQIVAHYDADPAAVEGTALQALLAAGALSEERAERHASHEALSFARALGRLGRFEFGAFASRTGAGVGTASVPVALSAAQSDALRRMLLALVADPRLVLARIAEQLWLLRQARSAPSEERRRLALQAREVYAPLANRLGLALLKWELEDYAFRYLEPDDYRRIAASLNERRADRERYIAELCALLTRELAAAGIKAVVAGRPKHIYSIWRKMQRKQLAFEQLFDVRAVRVLVDSVADCYAALGVVHGLFSYIAGEFDDYIATPKPNGYRSIHTAVHDEDGRTLEVQIRTHEMHAAAELGVAAHWHYKEGGRRDMGMQRKVEQLRALLAPPSAGEAAHTTDLLDRVGGTLFAEHVYALSPKGDVVELPAGATPLDFAYHVHTSLGHRCRGARVDGRMAPLDEPLVNGATVEIVTAREPQPSRDWLIERRGFLASKSARAKVRAWFRREDEAEHRAAGRALVERELPRHAPAGAPALGELAADLGFGTVDELYIALGAGDISSAQLGAALQRRLRAAVPAQPAAAAPTATAATPAPPAGIRVMGIGDLLTGYARCCRPVPPETICGYVTVGRGVTIHRADCANLARLRARQPDRVMAVSWSADPAQLYPVEFTVLAFDRRGLVRDVSAVLADAQLSIERMTTVTHQAERTAEMTVALRVHSLAELDAALARITGLPDVIRARRR